MAEALVTIGFCSLELKTLAAEIDPDNLPSIGLIEKMGFEYNQAFEVAGHKRLEYLMQKRF